MKLVTIALLAAMVVAGQGPADAYFQQGYKLAISRNFQGALEALTRAIQANASHDRAFATRAGVYSELGKHELAIADANRALALKPGNGSYLGQRAVVYREAGQLVRALMDADASVAYEPRNSMSYVGVRQGEFSDGGVLRGGDQSENGGGVVCFGDSHLKLRQYAASNDALTKAAQMQPNMPSVWVSLGRAPCAGAGCRGAFVLRQGDCDGCAVLRSVFESRQSC